MNGNTELNRELISVCIATYNREKLLKKLLDSLINQKSDGSFEFEIVIADNNPEGSARSVVEEFIKKSKISIRYFIQPVKNISLTRNVCIQNAAGDYLAFIDDDEIADENWLNRLYNCIKKYNADGVFGYVIPIFEDDIQEQFKVREYYFSSIGETGTIAKFYYTTNSLLKTTLLVNNSINFDPNYGLTGGEDVHFFEKLRRKGAIFIICKEAITKEFIPKERGNIKYLFLRSLRGGQSYLRRKLEFNPSIFIKILELVKSSLKFFLSVICLAFTFLIGNKSIKNIINVGDSIGRIRAVFSKYRNIY